MDYKIIEALSKILEFIAKYSWAVFALCMFVLILPEKTAESVGLLLIRNNFRGYWFLGLVLSGSLWIRGVIPKLIRSATLKIGRRRIFIQQLDSLDNQELAVIQWCLLHESQTFTAVHGASTLQSLVAKGIMSVGGTNMLSLPYIIRLDAWKYIKKKNNKYLPKNVRNNQQQVNAINAFASRQLNVLHAND